MLERQRLLHLTQQSLLLLLQQQQQLQQQGRQRLLLPAQQQQQQQPQWLLEPLQRLPELLRQRLALGVSLRLQLAIESHRFPYVREQQEDLKE